MFVNEKAKVGFVIVFLVVLTILVNNYRKKNVDIIYFKRPGCIIVNRTDQIIQELKKEFQERINIKMIDLDKELTEEENKLKEKYEVIGVPTIIINGKEYTDEFTKNKLEEWICGKFLIKPEVCR